MFFTAHLDVTPEAPGKGINPIVHTNYPGGDLTLSPGIVLSPSSPAGARLNELKGKTIVTTDGTTLLGADDKAGCTILVTLIEELVNNPRIKHPDLFVMFSQNEDIGRAAYRYDPAVFGTKPDIVIDVDGGEPGVFSAENLRQPDRHFISKETRHTPETDSKANMLMPLLPPPISWVRFLLPYIPVPVPANKDTYIAMHVNTLLTHLGK